MSFYALFHVLLKEQGVLVKVTAIYNEFFSLLHSFMSVWLKLFLPMRAFYKQITWYYNDDRQCEPHDLGRQIFEDKPIMLCFVFSLIMLHTGIKRFISCISPWLFSSLFAVDTVCLFTLLFNFDGHMQAVTQIQCYNKCLLLLCFYWNRGLMLSEMIIPARCYQLG